jgi:hypothetical protein
MAPMKIISGQREDNSWKKPKVKNLVTMSLWVHHFYNIKSKV